MSLFVYAKIISEDVDIMREVERQVIRLKDKMRVLVQKDGVLKMIRLT